MNKSLIRFLTVLFTIVVILLPYSINADSENLVKVAEYGRSKFCKIDKSSFGVLRTVKMIVTAYSSTEEQTDDSPFITASGKQVEDGIIANNMLSFGTKVRIPQLYGDKIFIVEDRMHQRKGKYQVDIWFSEYNQAKEFGAKLTNVEILES